MEIFEMLSGGAMGGLVGGILAVVVFFVLIGILKAFIKVTLPNKILVVNGRKVKVADRKFGFTVEKGRTNVIPYLENVDFLDLEVHPINVRVEGVNSANGITVGADATACVCIDDDNEDMLYSAVERLMGKSREAIKEQIKQTLVGNFRGALNKATPLQAIGMAEVHIKDEHLDEESSEAAPGGEHSEESERAIFRNELVKDINSDLSSFGMKVVSVSLQKIWDTSNYIANLAQKTLAQKRQEVEIEEARLRAKAEQIESDATRKMSVAKNEADEKILQSKQKYEMFKRDSVAQIQQSSLEADNAINEAENKGLRDIEEKRVELQKLQNISNVIQQASAEQKAADIVAEGEGDAVRIVEEAKNTILRQKMALLDRAGETGKLVLFMKELHHLFDTYKEHAKDLKVDSLVVMDDKKGFNGAVNRGPSAFVDYLKHFYDATGINIKDLLETKGEQK